MPRLDIDYTKVVIYKIVCNDLNILDCYVGSTTNFTKRKNAHKRTCNNINIKNYTLKVYQFIRANGGWDNWSMLELEKYPCNDNNEATTRERYWFELLSAKLNTLVPSRSNEEYHALYRATNRADADKVALEKEYKKQHYLANKEAINAKHKLDYIKRKEKKENILIV